ncbi:MAG: thymidylate synthase, partial [Erysipelotrichaceae bacterium]|nr:thymidylate synthase [Erysipelotrichaceae bacterium]
MALAPCHCLFQFYVRDLSFEERVDEFVKRYPDYIVPLNNSSLDDEIEELFKLYNIPKYKLDCQLYQRSADYILGVPFNIASYALFTMMIAQCVDMLPGEFIHTFGDCHIYNNHIDTYIASQMDNEPYPLSKMTINPEKKDIFSFTIDDFTLADYQSHKKIDYVISV